MFFNFMGIVLSLYNTAIIIYILMSWFPNSKTTGFGMFLHSICEPYLEIFRGRFTRIGMFDFSPIIAIFVLYLAQIGLLSL